jgi:hypothetical protein
MLRLAEEAFRQPYSVSGIAIRLREDHWESFAPDACYPGLDGFRALRLESFGHAYAAQKAGLDEHLDEKDHWLLVASYAAQKADLDVCLGEKDHGQLVASYFLTTMHGASPPTSFAFWVEDQPTLLPRTEKVFIAQGDPAKGGRLAAIADWKRVRKVVGSLMMPVDKFPQRFFVASFPTNEQLEALGFAPGFEKLAGDPADWFKLLQPAA